VVTNISVPSSMARPSPFAANKAWSRPPGITTLIHVHLCSPAERANSLLKTPSRPYEGSCRWRLVAEHPADRLDPEAVTALLHDGDHLVRGRSRPAAKMALAAFRISLARRSSAFSARNRFNSSRSTVDS
jgi:hypothetical protein